MTNLERIQNMNAEQLADFLENGVFSMPWCNASEEEVDPDTLKCKRWDCVKCARDWLQQEVDNGDSD